MAIQITPRTRELIEELLASGRYSDEASAVESALSMLATEERKLTRLKAELDIARHYIERGELTEFTRERAEYLMEQAKDNYKAGKPIKDAVTP